MKLINILPLVTISTAFILPDDNVMSQIAIESHSKPRLGPVSEKLPSQSNVIENIESTFSSLMEASSNAFDQAIEYSLETKDDLSHKVHKASFDTKSWIDSAATSIKNFDKHHGHHGHHHKPNMTVYELISKSKYTTKLAALINEYEDIVELLNGTSANFTVFAPTDCAFEKIPDHAPKPSKEELKKILTYHVSSEFYPAGRVLVTHTVPMLLPGEGIGGEAQRVSTNIGLRGLTVNFYSRIIAIDIFGTNGVIHGVDSLLIPPPKAADVIQLLPGEFSTLELGLAKTGLFKVINDTSNHVGGTVFAPSNFAFQKLGPKINAFLFSTYGQKYLKALLKYHIVANQTLYSDAYYKADALQQGVQEEGIPKGYFHVDLPTLLEDKSLSIDVARYGRLIDIKINAFSTVTIEDGIVYDGVVHVVSSVLIPPKSIGGVTEQWTGEDLSVQELKDRLDPLIESEEADQASEEPSWMTDL